MGRTVGPEQVGVGQGRRITPIGLDLPRPGRVHRDNVWGRDDDLMAEPFETPGDLFAVGGALDQNARPGSVCHVEREATCFNYLCSRRWAVSRAASTPQMRGWRDALRAHRKTSAFPSRRSIPSARSSRPSVDEWPGRQGEAHRRAAPEVRCCQNGYADNRAA